MALKDPARRLSRFMSQEEAEGLRGRTVVIVEGFSDQVALETLARRQDRNLEAEGISIVPIRGAQAIGTFIHLFGPQGYDVRLAGLSDAGEEGYVRRALERAGFGTNLTRPDLERLGFYVCVDDLEDELIRSLGAAVVEQVIEVQGELRPFRTFQRQPAQQGRPIEKQLRRFMGTHAGRKAQYARALVDAMDLRRVPPPLDRLLAYLVPSTPGAS
ncbi:MAG: ATP-dependent endonuclease [Candidatus Dormibacteraeota bacterium]|nr:ATP-dependent endonuclease [Candidatus Dormibacteraeota bacterium]